MGWSYSFDPISKEDKHLRRLALDRYALIGFASSFAPLIAALLVRGVLALLAYYNARSNPDAQGGRYAEIPTSPAIKAQRFTTQGKLAASWRKLVWWMQDDVQVAGTSWGQKGDWLVGSIWTVWLLSLSVIGTGTDYFHLTKRFGMIAISQFPMQYILALKPFNLAGFAFATSHEEVNRYHRLLGRIVYGLVLLHMAFYLAYFLYANIVLKKLAEPIVFWGVLAAILFSSLMGTTMRAIRDFSYRIFFLVHLVAAVAIPILIFFHAHHAQRYVLIIPLVLFGADVGYRRFSGLTRQSTVEAIPGTNLLKLTVHMPKDKLEAYKAVPGSHVYLSLPSEARGVEKARGNPALLFECLFNPFTVAAVTEENQSLVLVVRTNSGPMTTALSRLSESQSTRDTQLTIDGPYGSMKHHLPSLLASGANRILLIAGGVGATFITPLYAHLAEALPMARIQMIWAMRTAGEATWTVTTTEKSLLEDPRLQLYLTSDIASTESTSQADAADDAEIELRPMNSSRHGRQGLAAQHNRRRPDLQKLIDDAFTLTREETVAVIVCGPESMAQDARRHIRPWVMKGRSVWWHSETFAW